jgi:signal transduction histidine kinase/FixJ family two-component response regulator
MGLGRTARLLCLAAASTAWLVAQASWSEPRPGDAAPAAEPILELTAAERAWIEAHPRIRISFDGHFPVYSYVNDSGNLEGLAVDFIDVLSRRAGLDFEAIPHDSWEDLYQAAQRREVDVVATMVDRPGRRAHWVFTEPYIHKSLVVMTRDDDFAIRVREDIAGKRVALVRNYQASQRVADDYPTAVPLFVETMHEALNAVSTGAADAAITFAGAGHYIQARYLITNLRFAAVYDRSTSAESIAVRSDWPELASILDKALGSITDKERLELQRAWLPVELLAAPAIRLTPEEKEWISQHPEIRLGIDPEFSPFEFLNEDGKHEGISADYIRLLNERLGTNMQVVKGLSWKQAVEGVRNREIDVLPAVGVTQERRTFLRFTNGYVKFHRVIITRTDMPFLAGLDDLDDLGVAVQENSSHEGYLRDHTSIVPTTYPTLTESLLAVSGGSADAFVGNVAASAYWIRRLNLTNLKVAAAVSRDEQQLHFAVRSDWPDLVAILQKGLDSISPRERVRISKRWVTLQFEPRPDYRLAARIALAALAALSLALLWVRQATKQAKATEAARNEALRAHERAEVTNAELRELRDHLEEQVTERTTQLRESERMLWQSRKMEALGTLVGGIAHDFNNVLHGIMGWISLSLERPGVSDDSELERMLSGAQVQGRRARDLIRQLLAFARREPITTVEVPLASVLSETVRFARVGVASDIDLTLSLPSTEIKVVANVTALQQLVLNLVSNARDATREVRTPSVEVRLKRVVPDEAFREQHPEASADSYALLEVEDNGAGIEPGHLERLFEPFFTTKEHDQGTGLGLAMVYSTVRSIGGAIEVSSEPGSGCVFRIFIPESFSDARAPLEESWDRAPGEGETILVVDDDQAVLRTTARILDDLGYRVMTATDGATGIEVFRSGAGEVAVVLMDVGLPDIDGVRAAERMREIDANVSVLFTTGHDVEAIVPEEIRGILHAVVSKPYSVNFLSNVLRETICSARAAADSTTDAAPHDRTGGAGELSSSDKPRS